MFFVTSFLLCAVCNGILAATSSFCTPTTPYSATNPATFPLSNAAFKESSTPTTAVLATTSAAVQTYITKKHNCLRSLVSPTATNMLKMSWNSEAAGQAQTWANVCAYGHNAAAARTTSQFACGQNIAKSMGGAISWNTVMNLWFNEVKDYVYGGANNGAAVTGHYTQIVWYNTFQVGCGWKSCPATKTDPAFNYYVCNYCPAGNILNSTSSSIVGKPYTSGGSCASCSGSCEDGKLCTNSCSYKNKYSNCGDLEKSNQICSLPASSPNYHLRADCSATCLCKGKII